MSWQERLIPGSKGQYHVIVDESMTAAYYGNPGVHVLATCMVGLFAERALNELLLPLLPEGYGVVGVRLQTFHRSPAVILTPITAVVVLRSAQGGRVTYDYRLIADGGLLLADGDGESAIVPIRRFLQRAGRLSDKQRQEDLQHCSNSTQQ